MEEFEIIKNLIKELGEGTKHEEYTDGNNIYVLDLDVNKDNVLFKMSVKENKDKEEFEKWVNELDDDIFEDVWQSLSDKLGGNEKLNEMYEGKDYKKVINAFKLETMKILQSKVNKFKSMLTKLNVGQ